MFLALGRNLIKIATGANKMRKNLEFAFILIVLGATFLGLKFSKNVIAFLDRSWKINIIPFCLCPDVLCHNPAGARQARRHSYEAQGNPTPSSNTPDLGKLFALRHCSSPCCHLCTGDILIELCPNTMRDSVLWDGITRLFCGHPACPGVAHGTCCPQIRGSRRRIKPGKM